MDTSAAHAAICALLARYGHCIDDDALEAWPDLFVADGCYHVTTRENHAKDWPIGVMYCDSRGMMQDRVTALRQAIVFEPHVYRHILSATEIAPPVEGAYAVRTSFHVLRTGADGAMVTYACGRYLDEIVFEPDGAKFRKRVVVLDSPRIDTLMVIPI
jgi:anthranilate 1,2-dioxygenase small subunit